jgi:hypothetical protein
MRKHDLGCPTLRDFRIVGTTGDGINRFLCRPLRDLVLSLVDLPRTYVRG